MSTRAPVLQNAGHYPMNETLLALVAAIERFLLAVVVDAEAASSPGVWPELCRDAIGGIVPWALGN